MTESELTEHYLAIARYLIGSMIDAEDRDDLKARVLWNRGRAKVEVKVPADWRGAVIGRGGHMIKSLRAVFVANALPAPGGVTFDLVD